jgi:hypothetical protein
LSVSGLLADSASSTDTNEKEARHHKPVIRTVVVSLSPSVCRFHAVQTMESSPIAGEGYQNFYKTARRSGREPARVRSH